MTAIYEDYYCKDEVTLKITKYSSNGNLAIQMISALSLWNEPFAMLTVNIDEKLPSDMAYVDINNVRTAFDFITKYKLGEFKGIKQSGYCCYPLIKFNLDEVKKYE